MRIIALIVMGLLAFGTVGGAVAYAADPPSAVPTAGAERAGKQVNIVKTTPHMDRRESRPSSDNPGTALLFWAFAAATIGGALFVITRRNLIAAVMGMVGSFLGISAVYMMLYAGFLSVVQMLVYAGAIMVLFVFVVMILNRPEDEPVAPSGRAGQALGGIAIVYLVGRLILLLINVRPPRAETAIAAPGPITLNVPGGAPEKVEWGSVKAVGTDLFGPGLFPFEAISILLLVAVVGAIAIARPLHASDEEGTS
ncbi:MAG: NADH-quinone oxidoreductase subunit J [Deltaproteobacteria bacterium]|nr:NADH-quinone oxidoreductase subunit J [Deltaproteobacteria bacterium]MCW5802466.1 NADH-quinone oxidoreductase subunit J [Deltaproteobacteria bacterium]